MFFNEHGNDLFADSLDLTGFHITSYTKVLQPDKTRKQMNRVGVYSTIPRSFANTPTS